MDSVRAGRVIVSCSSPEFQPRATDYKKAGSVKFPVNNAVNLGLTAADNGRRMNSLEPEEPTLPGVNDSAGSIPGKTGCQLNNIGQSTNILWHTNSVDKLARQQLLQQKGCTLWITGLSGSGKSTLACAVSRALYSRGKLTYILDGDNVRHGLNQDLSFKAEDRAENMRRIGEVAKLFADAGVICIVSVISPYRKDRDACRAMLAEGDFIEVFMDVPLQICEARDPKGLYKLVRAGKIKGFTGIDDPYEPPLNCEVALQYNQNNCTSPEVMAETVISYLEQKGFLHAKEIARFLHQLRFIHPPKANESSLSFNNQVNKIELELRSHV